MTVEALGWTLLHFLWQGALLACVLAVLQAAFKRATPQVRYLLAAGTLLAMLLAPVVTFQVVRRPPRPAGEPEAVAGILSPGSPISAPVPMTAADDGHARLVALRAAVEPLLPALVGLWGSGVLLLSLRSLGGWTLTRRLRHAGLAGQLEMVSQNVFLFRTLLALPPSTQPRPGRLRLSRHGSGGRLMFHKIILRCPGCDARIKAPWQLAGQRRNCPGCGTPFVVRPQRPEDSDPILVTADRLATRRAGFNGS